MKNLLFIFPAIVLCMQSYGQSTLANNIQFKKRTFLYKTADKVPINADLFQPIEDSGLRPVIIWIHGGALIFGNRTGLPEEQMKFYLKADIPLYQLTIG